MTQTMYRTLEEYMHSQMQDSAHDRMHIYRVLSAALQIAEAEAEVDYDVLIAACLLHDVGREQQMKNLELCHAAIGAEMAYAFLLEQGWTQEKAGHVRDCVGSHRYRRNNRPHTIEAKILFDADKLDVTGAIGIARTLIYEGQISEPLYLLDEDNRVVVEPTGAELSSFFQEFNYKLRHLYDKFHTPKATEMAARRKQVMMDFYDHLLQEVQESAGMMQGLVQGQLEE